LVILSCDIETYSSVDLGKSGVYAYTEAPDFEILLFGYAFDDEPVQVVDLASGEPLPHHVLQALTDPNVIKTAFNANFERTCISKHFGYPMPPWQWRCTQVHALTLGLPIHLEGAAKAMKLKQQKDTAGKLLIRYFSMPCKPTKTNGRRTKNRPEHAPEKWEQFKAYCRQDVEVEREIRKALERFPVPPIEQRLWELDQRINDSGVQINPILVANAITCDTQYQERLIKEAAKLTGLDNPKSVAQLKKWLLEAEGLEVESLNKDSIPELLKQTESETVKRVLELRQEMAKTSVKKYMAMDRARCRDNRIRGLLQFYGANRTGRWAGRLVQVQNLPQNKLPDLDLARQLLIAGEYETLELLYDSVPVVLSQLIRTAFISAEGHRFIVADFSAIEARVIAWYANEKWRLDVFNTHGKIYEASASAMFKVPIEEITKGNPLRQKGKVAELACIAEGQLVLTNTGLVPIENITLQHKVWDGMEFIKHEGLIFKGVREVMTYEGLTATPDHLVWVEEQSEPIRFEDVASSGAHLLRTGVGRQAIRMGRDYQPGKEMETGLERCSSTDPMCQLWGSPMDAARQPDQRNIKRMPNLLTTKTNTEMVRQEANGCQTALHQPERQKLCQLRSQRDRIPFQFDSGSRTLDNREFRTPIERFGVRQNRHKWPLRTGKYPIYPQTSKPGQQTFNDITGMESKRVAVCTECSYQETIPGNDQRGNNRGSQTGCERQTEKLAGNRRKVKVYDILNAGPRHRFTVSNCLVHNCGYQGGPGALISMGALKMGLKEEELPKIIRSWRQANPHIVQFWYDVERAAIEAVRDKTAVHLHHGLVFSYESGIMFIRLPSGRRLAYVRPRIEIDERFNKPVLTYEGMDQTTKQWARLNTYGGKLVENIVQATARDCLAEAMLRVDAAGYRIVMHVHDEVVLEVPHGSSGSLEEVCEIMGQPIKWAPGLPLRADGFEADYYKKD